VRCEWFSLSGTLALRVAQEERKRRAELEAQERQRKEERRRAEEAFVQALVVAKLGMTCPKCPGMTVAEVIHPPVHPRSQGRACPCDL